MMSSMDLRAWHIACFFSSEMRVYGIDMFVDTMVHTRLNGNPKAGGFSAPKDSSSYRINTLRFYHLLDISCPRASVVM
jgi:hypothetical protein